MAPRVAPTTDSQTRETQAGAPQWQVRACFGPASIPEERTHGRQADAGPVLKRAGLGEPEGRAWEGSDEEESRGEPGECRVVSGPVGRRGGCLQGHVAREPISEGCVWPAEEASANLESVQCHQEVSM